MFVLLFALLVFSVSAGQFDGEDYEKELRSKKFTDLWSSITADTNSLPWYGSLEEAELFLEEMAPSFDFVGDDMPTQFIIEERKKLIHTVGVIAKAQFKITNDTYTGIFRTGSDSAFLRFSLAAAPSTPGTEPALVPGIAIKFLRDHVASANIFSMYGLTGQSSYNFFEHDLSNHPPMLNPAWMSLGQSLLVDKFKTASQWPTMLGLSSTALYDQLGNRAPAPNFPYRIIFHATKALHESYSTNTTTPWMQQLLTILKPGKVFDVYGQDAPLQTKVYKIGEMHLTTAATPSYFGDRHYFHEHTRFEDDLTYKTGWLAGATQDVKDQSSFPTSPGYHYPDLPWE